jgi:hypothetical protein
MYSVPDTTVTTVEPSKKNLSLLAKNGNFIKHTISKNLSHLTGE